MECVLAERFLAGATEAVTTFEDTSFVGYDRLEEKDEATEAVGATTT